MRRLAEPLLRTFFITPASLVVRIYSTTEFSLDSAVCDVVFRSGRPYLYPDGD